MDSKFDPESGRQKNLSFLISEGPKTAQGCQRLPKGSPKGSQKRSKINKISMKILPGATPGTQGYPKGVKCTILGHSGLHFGTFFDENANKFELFT